MLLLFGIRLFNFDPNAMATEQSTKFREAVAAFAGCTGEGYDALLTSLPSELCYNDLRDAGRRHKKSEKTDPCNLHAVALKSCLRRLHGCQTLELGTSDWQSPLKGRNVKARVHQAVKATDVELGISCEGLTRHKVNNNLTKPHIFHQRLRLLKLLQARWETVAGDRDSRAEEVLAAYKLLWTSRLVPQGCFLQWTHRRSESSRQLSPVVRPACSAALAPAGSC